jgi:hypothetical protein
MAHWNPGGMDPARMHADRHHVKHELEKRQRERDMHHNIAEASGNFNGPRRLLYFPVRLFRWLRGT